jgi:hypothetical protein
MHQVDILRNGVEIGKVRFRGIAEAEKASPETRLFQCSPKNCVPKAVVRKIADRLAFGVSAGHEGNFEWHT